MNCIFLTFTVFQHCFKLQNIKNISEVEQKPISTTVLLEESKHYDITIESLKNGQILSVKTFKTRKQCSTKCFLYYYSKTDLEEDQRETNGNPENIQVFRKFASRYVVK